ncbi:hypothetical protein PIB30_089710 [Stylosanthes scabra]|uniref:Uncharacterized protein n=1 Tax=Stylosanthes scabra TaxID=79078 RepID=A0ABU6YWU5_9FABA|nr:hypothetical protein [Stylosanthes scabra]
MANVIGKMKMRMYNSSFGQWSLEHDSPYFIHYLDGALVVCNGVVHWINKVVEERWFPQSVVTYSLTAGTCNEVLVLQEAKQKIQLLVIHDGDSALLTHQDHLDEFDVNLWYIKHTSTSVIMIENNFVVHNSGFSERPKAIVDLDMINIFESIDDILHFGPNGYLRVVGNVFKINTVTHEQSIVRSFYWDVVEKFLSAYTLQLTMLPVCNDELA